MTAPPSMFESEPPTTFGAYCLALDAAMFRGDRHGYLMWRRVAARYVQLTGSTLWPVGEAKW